MDLIQVTKLHYRDYRSDKVYNAELCKRPSTNLWDIKFSYGRRGAVLVEGMKNDQPLPFSKAKTVYDKLIESKVKKGYVLQNNWGSVAERLRIYDRFANSLLSENYITQDEHTQITRMLYSNDEETTRLAELLIETKENKRWEQH